MPSRAYAKRALRFYSNGAIVHALLEINAAIEEFHDDWVLLCIRGRILAGLRRYPEAISDYVQVLGGTNSINQRNRLGLLHSIMVYATALSNSEKGDLSVFLRDQLGMPDNNKHLVHWDQWRWVAESRVGKHKVTPPPPPHPTKKQFKPTATGRIANIGKFLLDAKDIEKLNRLLSEPHDGEKRILRTYERDSL